VLRKEPRFGALTEMWAGLRELGEGEEKMMEDGGRNGGCVLPWRRGGHSSKAVFGWFDGTWDRGEAVESLKDW